MINVQKGDVGIQFVITITDEQTSSVINLSQANNVQFIFRQPDKVVYTVNGSLYTDGTDGKIQYTSQTTDLTVSGIWKFQCSYTLSGSKKITSWTSFQVTPNLSDLS